jgi:indolepyruvate ferredoxin oxidoreductase
MSVEPLETELGRKRRINQSTCNKDFSCVQGFCPSFVTVHGGRLRRKARQAAEAGTVLPVPALPSVERGYNLVLAGIGGTGIVTVGAMLAQAAHLDGLRASVLDLTGMAQKYGAVMSHLRFMPAGATLPSSRLAAGEADTVIGCDLIVTAGQEALSKMATGRTFAVVNSAVIPTGDFTRMPDWDPDAANLLARIQARTGGVLHAVDAERIATALLGDSIATNMFLLGFAWQHGRVPVTLASLERAIELSGVDVAFNRSSFDWGRRMAVEPDAVLRAAEGPAEGATVVAFAPRKLHRLEDILADRVRRLTAYQDARYAARYQALVEKARAKDDELGAGGSLARAVARSYYKLLANKDEYEVARLFSAPEFKRQLQGQFEGDYKLHFHLGAWPLARRDVRTGEMRKRELGPWILKAMGVLQHLRRLRGTPLDPFRNTPERKLATQLLARYEADISHILDHARVAAAATALASWPDKVRGYGGVRERHAQAVAKEREVLRDRVLQAHAEAA